MQSSHFCLAISRVKKIIFKVRSAHR